MPKGERSEITTRHPEEPKTWLDLFDRMMRPWSPWTPWGEDRPEGLLGKYPVDIREEEGKVIVDAELPGFKSDEVDVSIDRNMLRIVAERKEAPQGKEGKEKKGTPHLHERRFTRVERAFALPVEVDPSKAQAKLDNGVLHLEIPETEESKPHKIDVKAA